MIQLKKLTWHKHRPEKRNTNHGIYITTPEFTMLTKKGFYEELKELKLATKYDFVKIADFVKKMDLIIN